MNTLTTKRKLVVEAAKRREEKRCWHDHYRVKVDELKKEQDKAKSGFGCGPGNSNEKITRNFDKLNKAEAELRVENTNFDRLVKDIHTVSNQILNELTIRFTVQV